MQRVLLVEDEVMLRRAVERFLGLGGHQVVCAGDLSGAAGLLEAGGFDLLVTDAVLPDGDGFDLVTRAREMGIEAILMSAHCTPDLERRLARAEITFLAKPFDLELLQATVDLAFGRRHRGRG